MLSCTNHCQSISTGNFYEVVCVTKGAGTSRGEVVVVYRCLTTNTLYHRTKEDFINRMISNLSDELDGGTDGN